MLQLHLLHLLHFLVLLNQHLLLLQNLCVHLDCVNRQGLFFLLMTYAYFLGDCVELLRSHLIIKN